MDAGAGILFGHESGRSVAWLARLFRVQEVVSSNLTAPTISLPYFPTMGPEPSPIQFGPAPLLGYG